MSNVFGRTPSRDDSRNLPRGESIGRYSSYLDAQKAVDYLADQQFAVQHVSIIGNNLKTVERVTGRLSYPKVALSSAATGAWFGFFVGLVLMLFAGETDYLTVVSTMALGAAFWLFFGIVTYAFQRGKRDFTSTSQVVATSYEVIVDASVIAEAKTVLRGMNGAGTAQAERPTPTTEDGRDNRGFVAGEGADIGSAPDAQVHEQPQQEHDRAQPQQVHDQPDQQGGTPLGQFPDLDDGRPKYGIRTTDQTDEPSK